MGKPPKTNQSIPAKIETHEARKSGLSLVWLIPIAALGISLFALWSNYAGQGPVITVSFEDASGITADETKLKYRNVDVGLVEDVSFSSDLTQVIAKIRIDPEVASFVDAQSVFWVEKPRVSARGVSGLQTVLGGVYIEGSWDDIPGEAETDFTGLEEAPSSRFGADGLRVVLRAEDGKQIAEGTPVLYKGVEVGKIETPRLSQSGDAVLFDAFIEAPYDQLITTATRFWDASGISFSFGTGGARVDIESLAALVGGGVSFDTLVSGGRKPRPGQVFEMFESEDAVRNDLFSGSKGRTIPYSIVFEDNVSGLQSGAAVEFRGIKIGEVTSLSAEFEDQGEEIADIKLIAKVGLNPKALGLPPAATEQITSVFLGSAVDAGLRARLVRASLLTGGLKVELIELDRPAPASITRDENGLGIIPSVPADLPDNTASAEGMFKRINDLPIEELISSTIGLLNSVNSLANDPDLKKTPSEVFGLISDARDVVSAEQVDVLTSSLNEILKNLKDSSTDLARLTSALGDEDTVAQLRGALTTSLDIVADLKGTSAGLPAIAAKVEELARNASRLPLDELVASTSRLIETVDGVAGSEAVKELPPALTAALDEIRGLTETIRSGNLVENASQTFASARVAADKVAVSLDQLPTLIAQFNKVARQAETTLSGFDEDSRFSASTRDVLREIKQAAESITSLARAIERRPNSLITGR